MNVVQLIRALPKVEQHIHIVGSIRPETLLWLAEESDIDIPCKTVEDVRHFFQYRNFSHFISIYGMVVDCITKENQFERITYEMLESEASCNVRYVEASFSAPDHVLKGLDYSRMLDAINKGVRQAYLDFRIECNLRIDLVRNYGPKLAMEVLDWIESKNDNIVSIDIGGSEEKFPPKPFAPVYKRAKNMGLHLVAHAGEAAGPESVWEAVRDLGVEHVGHGLATSADLKLMDYILERNITIEACPTSNVKTGVISSLDKHPIRTFLEYGINVTVNTDDPSMFDTDMNKEYLQLYQKLNFTVPELFKFSLNGVNSSFLPEDKKTKMRESFIKEYQHLLTGG